MKTQLGVQLTHHLVWEMGSISYNRLSDSEVSDDVIEHEE
jgi:hypothetical protein